MPIEVRCVACSTIFRVKRNRSNTAKFCSPSCRATEMWRLRKERAGNRPIPCATCGTVFPIATGRMGRSRYCSRECCSVAKRRDPSPFCLECKRDAAFCEFEKDKNQRRKSRCKQCHAKKAKVMRALPWGRFKEAKGGAKARGYEWRVTFEQFLEWIANRPCTYCGSEARHGIDRINNEPYYDISNVVPCCGRCNEMKNTATAAEFLEDVRRIAEYRQIPRTFPHTMIEIYKPATALNIN